MATPRLKNQWLPVNKLEYFVVIDNPSKFADRFSVSSPRLPNWDYSSPGIYFVTICTLNHNPFFGKIINNKMIFSPCGQIVRQCLIDIPKHFPNVKLLDYVVMPNHLHILMETIPLRSNSMETSISKSVETHRLNICRDVACNVSTYKNNVSTTTPVSTNKHKNVSIKIDNKYNQQFFSRISPKLNSISTIIRSFKSAVTRQINPKTIFFVWQSRFYDEIIKDNKQLSVVKQYIQNNVTSWEKDKFYRWCHVSCRDVACYVSTDLATVSTDLATVFTNTLLVKGGWPSSCWAGWVWIDQGKLRYN